MTPKSPVMSRPSTHMSSGFELHHGGKLATKVYFRPAFTCQPDLRLNRDRRYDSAEAADAVLARSG